MTSDMRRTEGQTRMMYGVNGFLRQPSVRRTVGQSTWGTFFNVDENVPLEASTCGSTVPGEYVQRGRRVFNQRFLMGDALESEPRRMKARGQCNPPQSRHVVKHLEVLPDDEDDEGVGNHRRRTAPAGNTVAATFPPVQGAQTNFERRREEAARLKRERLQATSKWFGDHDGTVFSCLTMQAPKIRPEG
eukprot:NODE_3079_length_1054_cov_37.969154_g2827_i0.p1 GENE.NODE_3079_length_1054_cov_37.969154_g2827_i0~~NODE_3079_length_1054_cov_37.969154_g2827_i0.p1  ORF type:complete len:189 (-),score=17.41 NODE_3079_length_1054_cov_37.969154_g2827_i0:371-937(-)